MSTTDHAVPGPTPVIADLVTDPPQPAPTPAGRRHAVGFWAVSAAFAVIMGFSAVPTPLYGLYAARDGFGPLTITIVYAVYAVGVILALFTVGHVSDWYGRRRLLIPALLTAALSAILFLLWRDLTGLIVARFVNGLAIGATTATATAWITELHAARRPSATRRRAEIVGAAANLGGIGAGPLIAGALAQWVAKPLTVPYLVFLALMAASAVGLALTPETRTLASADRPRYHPQRITAPAQARAAFIGALIGAFIAFAALAFFMSLAPTFLAGPLGHPSRALAGAVDFLVFAATATAQILPARYGRQALAGIGASWITAGSVAIVVAVQLSTPSLWLFLLGGAVLGFGAGAYFKSSLGTVIAASDPGSRAGALTSFFLTGYVGLTVPAVGLGVLAQHVAADTALLIFGVLLVTGVATSAAFLLHRPR
ncbi:MFS transporter [Actinomadura sp. NTSP31]|uniref:MFS transporter n=1 Tax=Actinomadura sp. NTSP31 TaxID=1735447 RepID=UPI0035BFCB30